ncbi:radical SAM family heme chaperone HemW [Blautia sp. XA-2221]|uniref:radical SAM family heme chaperone HemW n=1 Tax=Blautia sp. XA-2221 TaxID=2903961 RepID=UPI0023792AB1|nr:radical SAM family heme chaperone HemW [Blautia sp. XA-2221]
MRNKGKKPLELYLHIPFCVKKCDYCDFLSGPFGAENRKAYTEALLREIQALPDDLDREIVSVFTGGGTPSLLDAPDMERIMTALRDKFEFSENAEITIEANPGTLSSDKLEIYRASGINRLSLGLQSTDNRELQILGRIHTYEEFLESYELARTAGFDNINIDLMSAIPEQTCEKWIHNLRTAAELKPEHISAYSLIVEEGTPFAQRELKLPDEEQEYQMYEDTADILKSYGFEQYEISNYAKNGYECRHNLGYWKRTEYLGLGLGAASLTGEDLWKHLCGERSSGNFERECINEEYRSPEQAEYRFCNTRNMQEYLENSRNPRMLRRDIAVLSEKEQQEEFMFLGLRMTKGISVQEFRERFGKEIDEIYGKVLRKYEAMGFMEKSSGFWRFTRKGIHVSNHILSDFLQD